ncbi:retinaldehyde-binding protein 1-like isoform X2 [Toxorhynchites rutilus septentrionalis]|uniref:retinaldehyde-binding protein 1-like isoform X2 n=1 Tax=Toxorhynchites rutilus septentrionalis TaxID=329112 RepID=UPI002478853C|nr:retinaldehyde-binding protein 1-like isoform X2 [Toxorhynchites rutilus septentrionalis]
MFLVPGLEKKPHSYDEYHSTLEPKYQDMARDELREEDYTRGPALAQLREFIAKHPQIQRCRTDPLFLLRFLRSKKFNVVAACDMLEKFLIAGELYPDFFTKIDPLGMKHLVEQGIIVPIEQDRAGRLVIILRMGQFDPETVTPEEECRLTTLLIETYMDTEIYQITGIVLVFDLRDTKMAHFSMWTYPKLKMIMTAMDEILAFRIKEIHIVQLPKYAAMIADFCIAALSSKLRQRLKFHKSLEEFKDAIDETILPTIYGGKLSLEEANERFLKRTLEERDRILKHTEMFIDLSIPNPNSKNSNAGLHSNLADESVIGSFRKLNVD